MARKEKLTLDYFPHYAVQGDIPNIIQERYGNDGYAVLYKNYEQFCLRDRQFIDLNEYVTLASIAAYCKVTEERYIEIVNTLVNLGTYDKELWEERKILISKKFIENTKDAYKKRTSECVDFDDFKNNFLQKSTSKCISSDGNQQIKVNQIKGNNNILSLNNNGKRLGKRERDFLKSYCERHKVENLNAYIRTVINNGDYIQLIKEEEEYQCKIQKRKTEQTQKQPEIVEAPEVTEQAFLKFQEKLKEIKRSKINETMGKSPKYVTN